MNNLLHTSEIRTEADVVFVRQRARQIACLLGFEPQAQTRIATAVSEIARNAFLYALGGRAEFCTEGSSPDHLVIRIADRGKGISNLSDILAGNYTSRTGLGLGLLGARKLMDRFRVETAPSHGTTVEMAKALPSRAPKVTPELLARIGDDLGQLGPNSLMEEIREQNIGLLRAFDELRSRQIEQDRLSRELADVNRQMTAINLLLEEKADGLERSSVSERSARAEAEAAVASRDQLLAIVSHDLRTPLSAIVSGASYLNRVPVSGPEGARVPMAAQAILRSAQQMTRLIADLLDLAQIQAGHLAIEKTLQDAGAIVGESVDMLRPLAANKDQKLEGTGSPDLALHCDRERILQVLSNLVGNAIKFTPRGGAIFIQAQAAGPEVQFLVRDSGPGIAEEDLPRIFDRFWQARKDHRSGIGLGLTIVKGLVEAHGGRLWVESTVGSGTSFYFTLPLASQDL